MEFAPFNPGDIVFLKYSPDKSINDSWPCIGSPYEIDCKILEVMGDITKQSPKTGYRLISGSGRYFTAYGNNLVRPKDKILYQNCTIYKCDVDTELFPKDTVFTANGDYACNDSYGVYIGMDRLNSLVKKKIFSLLTKK